MSIKQILQPMNNSRRNSPNTPTLKINGNKQTNSCFKHNIKATFMTIINQKQIKTCDQCTIELLKQGYQPHPIDQQQSPHNQEPQQLLGPTNLQPSLLQSLQHYQSNLQHYQSNLQHLSNTIQCLHSDQQYQLNQINQLAKEQLNLSYQTQLRNVDQYFIELMETVQQNGSKIESIQSRMMELIDQSQMIDQQQLIHQQQQITEKNKQLMMFYNQIRNSLDTRSCQIFQINSRSKIQELNDKINMVIVDFIREHIQEVPLSKLAKDRTEVDDPSRIRVDDQIGSYQSNNLDRNESRVMGTMVDNRQQINSIHLNRSIVSPSGSHQKARNHSHNSNRSSMIVNDKVVQEENYMEQKIIQTFKDNQQSSVGHNHQSQINSLQSFLKNQISPHPHQSYHKDLFNSRHLQELSPNTPSPHFYNKKKI